MCRELKRYPHLLVNGGVDYAGLMDLLKSDEWKRRRRKPKQHKEKSIEELAIDVAKQKRIASLCARIRAGKGSEKNSTNAYD